MSARAIWKGVLKLGPTRVPVKLYSAVRDRTVRFNVLEKRTLTPIKQHMVDPESGEEIPRQGIRKGYEIDRGTFVLLDDKEIHQFEPEASRDIEVLEFVSPEAINHQWYDRPYYLGPDGAADDYFALEEALRGKGKEGIARWVMRNKLYLGALTTNEGYLTLVTLRHAEEVLLPADFNGPHGRPLPQGELKMAEQLVKVLQGDFHPEEFKDDYRERLMNFIETKAKGRKPRLHVVRSKGPTMDLMDKLTKSLKSAQREKKVA